MHEDFLRQSLILAETRRGFCAPNPAVGAVVVHNNQIIAQGSHWAAGHPHAEVVALNSLTPLPKDAVLYISLEPCCHTNKKTPPCTDLIIQSGIKKVIFGLHDPNPAVSGQGQQILQQAGIECIYYPIAEINHFYQSYIYWIQTKLPYVTAKLALSLDNKIAGANGQRMQITGEQAKQFTHQQRLRSDAILTTAKTILADNPLLNIRLDNTSQKKPVYILDRQLTVPLGANIFSTAETVTVFCDQDTEQKKIAHYESLNIRCVGIPVVNNKLNLLEILKFIGRDGNHELWVEVGGVCFSGFGRENLLNCAYIYLAPKFLGINATPAFTEEIDFLNLANHKQWQILGEDIICKLTW